MRAIEQITQFFRDSENFTGNVKENENLSSHTTMHVGGAAKIFLEPEDTESCCFAIKELSEEKTPFFILGGGSNVIINDEGLDAVISTRKMKGVNLSASSLEEAKILQLEAGVSWGSVIAFCRKNDLGGFEGFTGLSGSVGGALYMNATCFGLSACDNLLTVDYFDLSDDKIHTYKKNPCDWGYKRSPFQKGRFDGDFKGEPLRSGGSGKRESGWSEGASAPLVILSAKFSVTSGFDAQKSEKCLADRKEKGHFKAPSAGSAFKNDAERGIIAGKIIDECGLKGFSVGGAQIAPWHGNFIINPEQKARASDIKKLSDEVKKIVLEKKGISLENEILFV